MAFGVRKFYADDIAAYPTITPDILATMASQGVKTDFDSSVSVPNIETATTNAPATTEPAKTETETKPVEPAPAAAPPAPNGQEGKVTVAPAPEPAAVIPAADVPDWREQIKQVDGSELLKELGFDEKMVGFFNKWRTDGDITDYLRAVTVDFGKMTPQQLMKYQLEQAFPEFSPADLEELYQAKVVDHYKLDPNTYTETEVKRGNLMLTADAKAIRESLTQKQREFILSAKPPIPVADTAVADAEAYREQQRTLYANHLNSSSSTSELLTNKRLVLGEGESAFNYGIDDPQRLLTILTRPEEYARHVFKEDGSPMVEKQLFIAAAAIDHVGLINKLIQHGKALGGDKLARLIDNAKPPTGEPTQTAEPALTPAQALARSGVITAY